MRKVFILALLILSAFLTACGGGGGGGGISGGSGSGGGGGGGGGSGAGTTWTLRSTGKQLNGVAYGNNTFVVVGENGIILTSSDGMSWTVRNSGANAPLYSVTYGNGLFVAVGWPGLILTSPDGVNWTVRTPLNRTTISSV
jgi:hypothetical protein